MQTEGHGPQRHGPATIDKQQEDRALDKINPGGTIGTHTIYPRPKP